MKWLNRKFHIFPVAILAAFAACTKTPAPTSPEAALDQYVKTAFNAKNVDAKQALLNLSDGEAFVWLQSMTPEVFKKQFIENNMQLVSMKTRDRREEKDGDVSLVYELEFRDGKAPAAAAYSNKKIAFLKKNDKGEWKITATKNIKTFIERKDALEVLTPETTDKEPTAENK